MSSHGGLYDPYQARGDNAQAQASQSTMGGGRTDAIQEELNGAMKIMQDNIQKTSERGERLNTLQDKSDRLAGNANQFRQGANRVRKQMWWKDMKMRMCIIVGIILLLIVIIVPSVVASKKN